MAAVLVGVAVAPPAALLRVSSESILLSTHVGRVYPAIAQLQTLSEASAAGVPPPSFRLSDSRIVDDYGQENAVGIAALNLVSSVSQGVVNVTQDQGAQDQQVSVALKRMRRDMISLDTVVSSRSQLTSVELFVLTSTVVVAAGAPWAFPLKVVEVLVPSMAALSAAIGLSAEYAGKTAVSRGKEVAAVTLQAAAESEALLAQAERAKAVVPLCVGISATASAFALLAPELVGEMGSKLGLQIVTEVYLICPLLAAIAAAVASLATAETAALASAAAGLGARRFASAGQISRTWLSASEQIDRSSQRQGRKWRTFASSVLLAPTLAVLTPGQPLPASRPSPAPPWPPTHHVHLVSVRGGVTSLIPPPGLLSQACSPLKPSWPRPQLQRKPRTIWRALSMPSPSAPTRSRSSRVRSAARFAHTSHRPTSPPDPIWCGPFGRQPFPGWPFVPRLHSNVSWWQAAVSDTYANQGARAGAIRPFTSATASLCAATTVAVVELLPIIPSVLAQSLTMAAFPLFGSLVAAAASVSKARCEVDAEAATAAANELSRTDGSDQINPVESTLELVRLSVLPYLESTSLGKRLPKQLLRRG